MIWPGHSADPEFRCTAWHAVAGHVVHCELPPGHPMPHATRIESAGSAQENDRVTWTHGMDREAAEEAAARWLQDQGHDGNVESV